MAEKFRNKYRIPSARLQTWDYGSNAAYFITICTKNRIPYFGKIVQTPRLGVSDESLDSEHDEEMSESGFSTELTDIGKMAQKYWHEIPHHFPFIKLGAFIIMPEHIHGIIIIDKINNACNTAGAQTSESDVSLSDELSPESCISMHDKETPNLGVSAKKWKPGTLGTIINQYKRIITIDARKIEPKFAWLPRFYDTIIRDDRAYHNITNYIINNPQKWADDNIQRASENE